MSGPFRFNQEPARSPLDRSASPFSSGQPVNFKTNVNRAKTKKWVQAKKNAYDGDDWGDYDEYDEYGVNQEPPPEEDPAAAQRYYAPRVEQPSRSFTDPSQQAPHPKARRNSFEHGEEQRAFSSSIPQPQPGYGQPHGGPAQQASGPSYEEHFNPQQQRDFSPTALPPPLQTRFSQVPAEIISVPNTQFPPRKSSISQVESPTATSPRPRTGSSSDKPLPFIRPADIYKRMEDERVRERASLDSSRPSLDSLSSRPRDDPASPQAEGAKSLHPLETVAERKSEYLPDYDVAHAQDGKQPAVAPHDDQGFRSVVDTAFVRNDDQRSIPPTPVSKDSNSEMSRTNTGSTSGISPIMSRVPSTATSALKNRGLTGEGNTPAIVEEAVGEAATPVSRPTTAFVSDPTHHNPQTPTKGHSRNFSGSSLPRSGFATPTRGESPARSSVIAIPKDLPEPVTAQISTDSQESPDEMEGGLRGPSSAYATREADIATAVNKSPISTAPRLAALETQSQNAFLESHQTQSPIQDVIPRDRSESPSKGRVQALAGRFGDVSQNRRGSTQSNTSRNSVQSWEKSQDNSRAASPTKGIQSKPSSPVKEFRPHLPGQWESYATTVMTPSEQGDREKDFGFGKDVVSSPVGDLDLTPTTARRTAAAAGPSDTSDPIAALKDAGAAMVQSFRTTVGLDAGSSAPQEGARSVNHGDMYLPRPLQLDRTISSQSSIPPTPPAKDTPASEYPPTLKDREPSYDGSTPEPRPTLDSQLSTDISAEDQESDRLRKEIVASLSPVKLSAPPSTEQNRTSLQPLSSDTNRASSILPSEYDTYWADEDMSTRPSHDVERSAPLLSTAAVVPPTTHTEEIAKPAILNRFSWEASNSPSQGTSEQPLTALVMEPTKALPKESPSSPTAEHVAAVERQQWSEGLPDPFHGPGHVITVTKPDPVTDAMLGERSPSLPLDSTATLASPTREHTRSPGLHVVNTEDNPEAVDLPPRFTADQQQAPRFSPADNVGLPSHSGPEEPSLGLVSSSEAPKTPITQEHVPTSPTDKPLGAREIATINSTAERIATYNTTREHWATADHGLESWLTVMLQANPELASQSFPIQRMPTGSARHRHTGSLAILGKLGGTNHNDQSPEQHNNAGAQLPVGGLSPTSSRPSGPGFGGRVASQQMQLKGEKLLHTANVLSGKGMTSAKGLFAKGKSRFGRDKQASLSRTESAPCPREASQDPESRTGRSRTSTAMTATPEKPSTRFPEGNDSPGDERRSRRFSFSSAMRRVSRSGSRPNSIALPSSTTPMFGNTPRNTPPRERSRFFSSGSRPHSFHTRAPDSWDFAPGVQTPAAAGQFSTPSPSQETRLGILPSPAKSAFSSQEKESEDIPPVPPIPSMVAQRHYRRMSQDETSHRMLQSVIRYSTPPAKSAPYSPVFANADTQAGAQEAVDMWKGPIVTETMIAKPDDLQHPALRPRSAPHGSCQQNDRDDKRRSLQAILGSMPFTFVPSELRVRAQSDEEAKKRRRSRPVSYDSGGNHRAAQYREDWPIVSSANALRQTGDGGPLLSPTQIPLDKIPGVDNRLQSPTTRGVSDEVDIVSVGNVPIVLKREATAESLTDTRRVDDARLYALTHDARMGTARHTSFVADLRESFDVSPASSQERVHALANLDEYEKYRESPSSLDGPILRHRDRSDRDVHDRPAFETEIIGAGDVSPVSTRSWALADEDATPKAEKIDPGTTVWFAKGRLQLPQTAPDDRESIESPEVSADDLSTLQPSEDVRQSFDSHPSEIALEPSAPLAATLEAGGWSPHPHSVPCNADLAHQTRAVSAMPYAVRAVEEYAASNSSLASWDHDELVTDLHREASRPAEMKDESDLVTPVAPMPRIVQNGGPQAYKAEGANHHHHHQHHNTVTSNDYFPGQGSSSGFMHQSNQLHVSNRDMNAPERSKSILSQISAMVSDVDTLSPTASTAGRSTPSTIRRMQIDPASKSPMNPAQIPEEGAIWNERTPTGHSDDYDLYSDHNGVVKDLQNESKQPIRTTGAQTPGPAKQSHSSKAAVSPMSSAPASRDGERPRYSTERPMSFISGPPDELGKPQDQINQFAPPSVAPVPKIPEEHWNPSPPAQMPTIGMAFSSPPNLHSSQSPRYAEPQRQSPSLPGSSTTPVPSDYDAQFRNPTSYPEEPPHESAAPSLPAAATSVPRPFVNGQGSQAGQAPHHNSVDPYGLVSPQVRNVPQVVSSNSPALMPDHDPRIQGQHPGPRNQYEYHQQMMQRQAMQGRPDNAMHQPSIAVAQHPSDEFIRTQDKPSSKPRLSSVFKNLTGKSQANSQHQQQSYPPHVATNSSLKPLSSDPLRNNSSHSAVSSISMPQESPASRPGQQPVYAAAAYAYTPNSGPESRHNHAGQNFVMVQSGAPRVDVRDGVNPASFQGGPPQQQQQQQQQVPTASTQSVQAQPFYTSTPTAPETGKKKRFSTLGALFNRVSAVGDGHQTKPKVFKEEKKAQKAQRNSTMPLVQAPVTQRPPEQPTLAYYPPGQFPPTGIPPTGPQNMSPQFRTPVYPQGAQNLPPQGLSQQLQQGMQPQQQVPSGHAESSSAYLRTKQLAEQHRAQRIQGQVDLPSAQATRPGAQVAHASIDHTSNQLRQTSWGSRPGGQHRPEVNGSGAEQAAYAAAVAARQQAEQQRQDALRIHEQAQAERLSAQQQQRHQPSSNPPGVYVDPRTERQLPQQHQQHPMFKGTYGVPQVERQQPRQQFTPEQMAYEASQRLQAQRQSQYGAMQDERLEGERQQQQQQPQQQYPRLDQHQHSQQQRISPHQNIPQVAVNARSVSGPAPATHVNHPISQRHVSSPVVEPQYDAPPIPAAYSPVSGAFVSPQDYQQHPQFPPSHDPRSQFGQQNPDPGMQSISPQVSAHSHMPPNNRTHSDASTVSVVSPISNSPDIPAASPLPNQRSQKPRMSSISEVGQQNQPWHLKYPVPTGATEQDIVQARQRQYMEARFTNQQQLQSERVTRSTSPHAPLPDAAGSEAQVQGGGFRELLPRSTPQSYPAAQPSPKFQQEDPRGQHSPNFLQPVPVHPGRQSPQPAAYPLPSSPDPVNIAGPPSSIVGSAPPILPPKVPHSPMLPMFPNSHSPSHHEQQHPSRLSQRYDSPPHEQQYAPPSEHDLPYEQPPSDEPPPSYDGPGVPHDGMDKNHPDRPRPSNITTDTIADTRSGHHETRSRQASIGLLQHPQPASMAASPQRDLADMGAESLRHQLLQQEEAARLERFQRAQAQRANQEREREERAAARARARELELSASGGGQVGSLRRVGGSRGGGAPGWERRGSTSRPVFELPAVEDDEPTMKATSYPGQEWVPPMWDD